ncbi:cell wall-binding repeat-containing protein [Agromyces sp. H66]|uniref:cell wall-binding repeat-containing protein n=1 Tax=Agromyces sp. H66 TaxID=2529859 RepID=UPI0010AB0BCA|nr:cell wall-binding repeat-containing protein [Agromyces sp. H66]
MAPAAMAGLRRAAVLVSALALLGVGIAPANAVDESIPDLSPPVAKAAPDDTGGDAPPNLRARVAEGSAEAYLAQSDLAPAEASQRLSAGDAAETAELAGGTISGTITYWKDGASAGPLATGYAIAYGLDDATGGYLEAGSASATAAGEYSIAGLPAGDYVVLFADAAGTVLRSEFWDDAQYVEWTPVITLAEGETRTGIDEQLEPLLKWRIAGADRYETAVGVSTSFPEDVPCVFIANGTGFADALSAGPAAAHCGGPLLLVYPTLVPAVVFGELQRLSPDRIVIAGGPGAVSAEVEAALSKIAPVTRYGGLDRYETSRLIVDGEFGTAPAAWVATGANFPDALAASAGAAAADIPVLIVPGSAAELDQASAVALTDLGATDIGIAGGTSAVSAGIETAIESLAGTVSVIRAGGADRYETGASIMDTVFGGSWAPYAFFASGENFPDALAGAPLAGVFAAPLYVTPASCVSSLVQEQVESLQVADAFVLGYYQQELYYDGWEPFRTC